MAVYTHKEPTQFLKQLAGERIHRAEALELYAIDRALVSALVERLERRVAFSLSVTDRELYLSIGSDTYGRRRASEPRLGTGRRRTQFRTVSRTVQQPSRC